MDLVEEFWEGAEEGGESGEDMFNKFMESNRKFFEGPEIEDDDEYEEKF